MKEEALNEINNELKTYINESSFISMKCRNKLLKMFAQHFNIDLDISNYKNVDLEIKEDFTVSYRGTNHKLEVTNIAEFKEKYITFKEQADSLIKKREIDFNNMNNLKNIGNLIVILCMIIAFLIFIYLGIMAIVSKNYYDCFWFAIGVAPWLFPKFKEGFTNRFTRAKIYLKRLIERFK